METVMKTSLKDQIRNAFVQLENKWNGTGPLFAQIQKVNPDTKLQSVYAVVSAMHQKLELARRDSKEGAGFEYCLPESAYASLISKKEEPEVDAKTSAPSEAPVLQQTEHISLELKERPKAEPKPPVIVVPEGAKARRKPVHWDYNDRLQFCRLCIEVKEQQPMLSFNQVTALANLRMPQEKQKSGELTRKMLESWFDDFDKLARENIQAEQQQREEEELKRLQEAEQQRLAEERAVQEQMQQQNNLLHSLGSEVLLAEVVRRGATLLESMLFQALSSPRIQDALTIKIRNEMNGAYDGVQERRNTPDRRHNPEPTSSERTRLKKLLIFGLNKPIHQNEIKRDYSNMFDLRFLAAKPNGAQLKAMSRAVEEVIVMTDHVDHGSTDAMADDNIKMVYVSGAIGKLRSFLSEKYAEENKDSAQSKQ